MPAENILRWASLPECETPVCGWSVRPFATLANVIAGQSPPSDTYNQKKIGLPFLQGNGDFSFRNPVPRLWCTSPVKVAIEGDTLISVRAPVGEINRADRAYAIGRGLAALRAKDCNADYLYHAVQRWRWCLQRVAQGTTFDAITARHFAQLRVMVPDDPAEQRKIAHILDSVDGALERTEAAVKCARELKRAILQRFFYSALGETAYADRPRKTLPAGWSLVPTEELLADDPKNGVSPEASTQPPGTPTFSIAAIRNGRVDLSSTEHLKYARVPEKVAQRYRLCRGDVLIVRGNANADLVGKAGMVRCFPEGCIYPDITKRVLFRTERKPRITPEFAVLVWNHPIVHNQILRRAKTSNGTLKINNRDVKQIVLPLPPEDEQATLVEVVSAVEREIDALVAVAAAQCELKKSLMRDLLTGQTSVNREAQAATL